MFASRGRSRGQHARDKRKARLPSLEKLCSVLQRGNVLEGLDFKFPSNYSVSR